MPLGRSLRIICFVIGIESIILSCNAPNETLIGRYVSEQPTTTQYLSYWVYEGARRTIRGQELILKKDSTYVYHACGLVMNGRWKKNGDSLVLNHLNKHWKSDSLIKISYPFAKPIPNFFNFRIKEDVLVSYFKGNLSDMVFINQLQRVQ